MLAAVVWIVKVDVPLAPDESGTLAGFKLQVGRLCAPEGDDVKAQIRFMVPEYVLPAEIVTAAVPLLPGETAEGDRTVITT